MHKAGFFVIQLVCLFEHHARLISQADMSRVVRKPALYGNREADQRLCFSYIDSTIPLLPKYEISSL